MNIGQVIEFTCNGRGRGGHYHVSATVTKINPKTVKAIECTRSYSPGTRWIVAKDQVNKVREPTQPCQCMYCNGTGKERNDLRRRCFMCGGTGVIPHESWVAK